MKIRLLLFCLLSLSIGAGAQVSKWVDAQGRIHYGDRPPAGGANSVAMRGTISVGDGITAVPDSGRGAKTASEEFATATIAPRPGEVWIYTTPDCGYCKRAKEHMRLRNVRFVEKDITASAVYKSEFRAIGGRGVPVSLSNNQRINGYSEGGFDSFLKASGL
jgi:glutaredoxin